ncbi:MAG: hypothetical protein AB3N10_10100 [Allomuricauda sp.]
MKKLPLFTYFSLAVLCLFAFLAGFKQGNKEKVYVLPSDMKVGILETGKTGSLPAGTKLYFHSGYSEGFEIYSVYIRINGGGIPLVENEKVGLISPIYGANPAPN